MAEALDVNTLKRRSRRRLVGAVALVLLAVIVLPMVFDTEPRQTEPSVSVRIPPEDDAKFAPQLSGTPASGTPSAGTAPASESAAPSAKPQPLASAQPAAPAATKSERPAKHETQPAARGTSAERARAEAALKNIEFVVPVAALADPDKVKALTDRLAAAKMPYYTEPVATASGPVTRVRAGPFANRGAADRALEKLKGMGLKPGKVIERS
ncbi:MAG: SPOR domain-containing protein [Betaproteobacteria bacterium]|nr:SPOR domain-containing protein [Betaproteobacteria bacterium]